MAPTEPAARLWDAMFPYSFLHHVRDSGIAYTGLRPEGKQLPRQKTRENKWYNGAESRLGRICGGRRGGENRAGSAYNRGAKSCPLSRENRALPDLSLEVPTRGQIFWQLLRVTKMLRAFAESENQALGFRPPKRALSLSGWKIIYKGVVQPTTYFGSWAIQLRCGWSVCFREKLLEGLITAHRCPFRGNRWP